MGQVILDFQDLWLAGRLLASEGEEADLVRVQIPFTAYQAMGPHLTELPGLPQQGHLAEAAASPQVDQPTMRPLLQVELPVPGKGPAVRSGLSRAARCFSNAATYFWECPCNSSRSACWKRDQTLACHQPL